MPDLRTLEVSPPPALAGRRRRLLRALVVGLVCFVFFALGFSVSTSLAARVSTSVIWLLAVGIGASLLVPALLGFWLRRVGRTRERPRTVTMLCLCNALLVGVAAIGAPRVTRASLGEHGAWWVDGIARLFGAKDSAHNSVVLEARAFYRTIAKILPGAAPAAGAGSAGGRGTASSQGSSSGVGPKGDGAAGLQAARVDAADAQLSRGAEAGADDAARIAAAAHGRARLSFQRRGSGIIVPVILRSPTRQLSAKMLFDTGATLTTITESALQKLGLYSGSGDATIVTRTANGRVRRSITVIDGVSLGGARVDGGVTVVVCEPCGNNDVVGLLGLNVSRHFRVTLDHDAGEMTLEPKRPDPGHLYDIRPFARFGKSRGFTRGPKMTITGRFENRSPRALSHVHIEAKVSGGRREARLWTDITHVPPRGSVPIKLEGLLPDGAGRTYTLRLDRAAW